MAAAFPLYVLTFILAMCSMSYEFILAQGMSAFLENTILRYSITIGIYMCSMGFGALFAEGRWVKNAAHSLIWVEILLTLLGGLSIIFLYVFDFLGFSKWAFVFFAHSLIAAIGFLTGCEIPLLIELLNRYRKRSESVVLALNYMGAFCGTLIFAFVFYPRLGLVVSAFIVGSLNAVCGLLLVTQTETLEQQKTQAFYNALSFQAVLFLLMFMGFFYVFKVNQFLLQHYSAL